MSYRKKKDQKYFSDHWIEKKLVHHITKNKDNRYYLFRKVLSTTAVETCLKLKPKDDALSIIEQGGRKFDANGKIRLTKFFRKTNISFQQRIRKPSSKSDTNRTAKQQMTISEFYIAVASYLGMTNAHLVPTDKLIVHGKELKVGFNFFFLHRRLH